MKFIKTMLKEKPGKINSNLSAPATGNNMYSKPRRTMLALEPRIMFDGAAAATAADAVTDPKPPVQDTAAIDASKLAQAAADAAPAAEPTPPVPDVAAVNQDTAPLAQAQTDLVSLPVQADPLPPRTEIMFIESNVADYQMLIDGAKPGTEVHVLDAGQDGLAQMAQILDGRSGIDAIHIMSHGSEAAVGLGALTLTAQNLSTHAADLATIGQALNPNADILLYGCDVGKSSDGAAFISALAQTTHADIAASNDATGSAGLGGNWTLEVVQGNIEAQPVVTAATAELYQHVLNIPSKTMDFSGNYTNSGTGAGENATYSINGNGVYVLTIDGLNTPVYVGGGQVYVDARSNTGNETKVTLSLGTGKVFTPGNIQVINQKWNSSGSSAQSLVFKAYDINNNLLATQNASIADAPGGTSFNNVAFTGMTDAHSLVITATSNGNHVRWLALDNFAVSNVKAVSTGPTTTVSTAALSADTGTSTTDFITKTAVQTISGTLSAATVTGETVQVSYDNGSTWSNATNTVGQSTWSTTTTLSGSNTFQARVTNSGGSSTAYSHSYTLDTIAPSITGVTVPNASMKVSDTVTATLTVADDGGVTYTLASSTIDGFTVSNLSRTNSTTYTAQFTVTENGADIAAASTIPLSLVLTDTAGNSNTAYTTAINQASDAINAHTPTDVALSNATVQITAGANAVVGSLSSTDGTTGDTFTYTLVSGTGSTNNASFNISGSNLRATTPSGLSAGSYSVRVRSTDAGGNFFEKAFTVTVSAGNTAPTIANLNADSVAWAGVGNTVALDSGTALTIADTENDAANWNGSSLTVQRIVGSTLTPLSSDLFSFNATGFTVSGSNLQTGGSTTFGTFTNIGGVLTISFNASATNTLVRDVMRGVLYRNDTPTGDTVIRFSLSDGSLAATADVTVASDTIYVTNATDTATIDVSNGVSFSEAVAIAAADSTGSQTLVLNSAFATTGTTLAGNLAIDESLTVNTDAVTSGTTLTGSTITIGSGYTLTVTNASGKTTTVASTLAGAGGLSKTGAGTLTLSGTNSRTGATSITGGVLSVATDSNLDGGTATITLDGGTLEVTSSGNTTINNAVAIGAGGGTISVTAATGSQSVTFSGAFTSSAGITLAKTGTGNLQLTGATNSTSMLGGITVSAGGLFFGNGASDAMLANGTITLDGGGLYTIGLTGLAIDNAIVLEAGGGTVNISGASNSNTLSGIISGAGALTKTAGGSLTLSGNNTYTGATTVSAGTLIAGHANALGATAGSTSVASGATLQLANGITLAENLSINGTGASSAGALTVTSAGTATAGGTVTMTADSTIALATGTNLTVGGIVSGGFALTKDGAGTLTLSGNNTYTGATTVSAGTLSVAADANLGADAVTLAAGTTLSITGTTDINNAIVLSGAATISIGANTGISGIISGSGDLTKTGNFELTLSGNNTYTGATSISGGLVAAHNNALGSTAGATTVVTNAGYLKFQGGITVAENLFVGGTGLSSAGVLVNSSGINTLSGNVTLSANSSLGSSAGAEMIISGVVSGSFALTKVGAGVVTLSGANTYTGATTVSAGTLVAANASALGTTAGATTVSSGAALGLQGGITVAEAVSVTGTGVSSAGALVNISGTNILSGNVTMTGNSNLGATAGGLTLSGAVSGNFNMTKVGAGTLTLSGGSNTRSGNNTVSAGTLNITGTLGSGTVVVSSGATLGGTGTIAGAVTVNSGGTLSPGVTGTNNGVGKLTLGGGLSIASGGILAMDINGTTAGTTYDQVDVTGAVNVSGATLTPTVGYTPSGSGDTYILINNDVADPITGTFTNAATTIATGGRTYTASYSGDTGNDFTLTSPTPPSITVTTATLSADTGSSATDFITKTAGQTITGDLSAALSSGESVEVSYDNGATWATTTTATTVGATTWSTTTTLSGNSTFQARVTNTTGGSSTAYAHTYILDQNAPTLAVTSNVSAVKIGETATVTFTFSEDPGA
ncbi:MAG: DUF4347 domain-containing protein, partial [Methylobacter sp.]